MARKKSSKKMTITDFQSWLNGILEFQEDDWHPDASQWKVIKDKIDNLVSDPPEIDMTEISSFLEDIYSKVEDIDTMYVSQHTTQRQPQHDDGRQVVASVPVEDSGYVPPADDNVFAGSGGANSGISLVSEEEERRIIAEAKRKQQESLERASASKSTKPTETFDPSAKSFS